MANDLLDRLTALAAETSFDDLPDEAVRAAQAFLLDSLAVGVAGRTGIWRDAVVGSALAWGTGGAARILGDSLVVPPATAAFVNAYQMHCLEFDCVHEAAVAHVMTAVAAAAVAESERSRVDGRRLLLALALGVEIATALGVAANAPLRFFRPATVGVFGAATAIATLRRFDGEGIRRCFGHALGQVAGTMQPHEEGKPTLPVQLGAAARAGLVAADLAQSGMPAPTDALEGRHGYFPLFETAFDTAAAVQCAGSLWRVTELSHKPYPTGRATHGGIEAVLRLRSRGVCPDNLVRMTLSAPSLVHQLVVRPVREGMDPSYARLCFAYAGAVALVCGRVGIEHFTDDELGRKARLSLAARFTATVNDESDPAAFIPQTLSAQLKDGACMTECVEALPGSPTNPLSVEDREIKVRCCIAAVYGDAGRAARLIDAVRELPNVRDAATLLDPITGAKGEHS